MTREDFKEFYFFCQSMNNEVQDLLRENAELKKKQECTQCMPPAEEKK